MTTELNIYQELQEKGYALVSLFSQEDLNELKTLYSIHHEHKHLPEFYATMFDENLDVKLAISQKIGEMIEKRASRYLNDYRYLFANFLIKQAQSDHMVGIHQDWTYVQEEEYTSYNVWSALENTTKENGGLWILPNSHRFNNPYRGTPFEGSLYNDNEELIKQHAVFVPTQAGEAIIYNSKLIHFSYPNKSQTDRVAFAGIMIPQKAEAVHYFEKDKQLNEFITDEEFYCKLVPNEEPSGLLRQKLTHWHKPNSIDLANFIRSFESDGKSGRKDVKSR